METESKAVCSKCGTPLVESPLTVTLLGGQHLMVCPKCGRPKPSRKLRSKRFFLKK